MEQLGLFLLKSVLCSALFFGVYFCFFKNETFYRFNRYYLSAGLFCILILPLYTYSYEVVLPATGSFRQVADGLKTTDSSGNSWIYIALAAYLSGVIFLALRQVAGMLKIKKIVDKFGYSNEKGYKLVQADEFKSSFSFFHYVILDGSAELNHTERKLILEHELAHVKQQHWADLLLAQVVCAIHWFNPIIWFYLKALRQNHEFLADEAVLKQGNSPAVYRAVLVNHCIGTRVFSVSSSFYRYQYSRINMLTKPTSRPLKKIGALILLPALAFFIWAFAKPEFKIQQHGVKAAVQFPISNKLPVETPENVLDIEYTRQSNARTTSKRKVKDLNLVETVVIKDTAGTAITTDVDKVVVTTPNPKPLYLLDGVEIPPVIENVDQSTIESIHVLKDEHAVAAYGERGRNGVILIYTKKPKTTIE